MTLYNTLLCVLSDGSLALLSNYRYRDVFYHRRKLYTVYCSAADMQLVEIIDSWEE